MLEGELSEGRAFRLDEIENALAEGKQGARVPDRHSIHHLERGVSLQLVDHPASDVGRAVGILVIDDRDGDPRLTLEMLSLLGARLREEGDPSPSSLVQTGTACGEPSGITVAR